MTFPAARFVQQSASREPIGSHRHVVRAFITGRVPVEPLATDLVLDSNDPQFASTGLRVSSTLQLHRLMTATTTLIRRELGQLSPEMQVEVRSRLQELFGLK